MHELGRTKTPVFITDESRGGILIMLLADRAYLVGVLEISWLVGWCIRLHTLRCYGILRADGANVV
jgi:hypothetical protein